MLKRIFAIAIALCALSAYAQQAPAGSLRVGVVEFAVKGNAGLKDAGVALADWLSSALQRTGKYQVLERVLLAKVLEEQSIQLSGIVDQDSSVKIGALSGAQAVATGSLVEWNGRYTLTARLVDASTGRVISSASLRSGDAASFSARMGDVSRVLSGDLPQDALGKDDQTRAASAANPGAISVVKATKKGGDLRVVLDRGSSSFVERGATYRVLMPVYAESEVTGSRVVTAMDGVGVVVVDYVEPGYCAGELKPEGFSLPAPADLVREAVAVQTQIAGTSLMFGAFNAGAFYGMSTAGSLGEYVLWQGVTADATPWEARPAMVTGIGYNIPRLLGNQYSRTYFTVGGCGVFYIGFKSDEGLGYGWDAHGDLGLGSFFLRGGLLATKIFLEGAAEGGADKSWRYAPFLLVAYKFTPGPRVTAR